MDTHISPCNGIETTTVMNSYYQKSSIALPDAK
jgi:hypothetical protein